MTFEGALVPWAVALLTAAIAALTDVYRYKVYNVLTFPVLVGGLAYHTATNGWDGVATSSLGAIFGFAVLLIPYLLGGVGAGDVKFLMALGAWLGAWPLVPIFAVGAVATVIYAVVLSAVGRRLSLMWWSAQVMYLRLVSMGRLFAADDCREDFHDWVDRKDRRLRLIPFSAMLAFGLLICLLWYWRASFEFTPA